ncbi:MAG: cytidylate kinase family protein, partial [Faecousia sp.]
PVEQRIQRKMEQEKLSHLRAKQAVHKMDSQRKKYYEHYTGKTWGRTGEYDLYIDSGVTAIDEAVRIISARFEEL